MMQQDTAVIAANRFGLGARPGDLARIGDDGRDWLLAQLTPRAARDKAAALPDSAEYLQRVAEFLDERKQQRRMAAESGEPMAKPKGGVGAAFREDYQAEVTDWLQRALTARAPFHERLVNFWANHFAVSAEKPEVAMLAGSMLREAIRPHVLGRFEDLLLAAVRHPALLRYLDNTRSVGPSSPAGQARRKDGVARQGLNENLGREILELHTLGVDGGYDQQDVIELALAITGWNVADPQGARQTDRCGAHGFCYRPLLHEPGERRVMSVTYAEGGEVQGAAILRDLAHHPATARHLATKLARHFVADTPPPALVERLAQRYVETDGALAPVYRELVRADEAWAADARKFKRADEFLISGLRAIGVDSAEAWHLAGPLTHLGQRPFTPGSPAGWDDRAAGWIGPDGLWKRMQIAENIADRLGKEVEPLRVAGEALGPRLSDATAQTISRAETPQQGIALLLACPEFQWR